MGASSAEKAVRPARSVAGRRLRIRKDATHNHDSRYRSASTRCLPANDGRGTFADWTWSLRGFAPDRSGSDSHSAPACRSRDDRGKTSPANSSRLRNRINQEPLTPSPFPRQRGEGSQADVVTEQELLVVCLRRLEGTGIGYMLVGSMAGNYWGVPRSTHDIDFVIDNLVLTRIESDFVVTNRIAV